MNQVKKHKWYLKGLMPEAIVENTFAASFPWNRSLTTAAEFTTAKAPKKAWIALKIYTCSILEDKNKAKELIVKIAKPISDVVFLPILSDNIPPKIIPKA